MDGPRGPRPPRYEPLSRRTFLADLGRGTVGVLVFGSGLAACTDGEPATTRTGSTGTASTASAAATGAGSASDLTGDESSAPAAVAWERVALDFVSAYVLVREGEAAVVDTGVEGSAEAIRAGLEAAGVRWGDVGHIILTHQHPDHVGSLGAVVEAASDATAYAGAEDIPGIAADAPLTPVADGDDVFGLRIVATPGHTAGHVAVHDPAGGLLVAGDALTSTDGHLAGPNPEFTADMAAARRSLAKLAELDLSTVLVGHGEPVTGDDLAAQLRTLA